MPTRTELTDALIALIPEDGSRMTNAEIKASLESEVGEPGRVPLRGVNAESRLPCSESEQVE